MVFTQDTILKFIGHQGTYKIKDRPYQTKQNCHASPPNFGFGRKVNTFDSKNIVIRNLFYLLKQKLFGSLDRLTTQESVS